MTLDYKAEVYEMGLQQLITDKAFKNSDIRSYRDPSIGGGATFFNMTWKAIKKPVYIERSNPIPATFWDHIKAKLPLLKPRMLDVSFQVNNTCPHIKIDDESTHLDWLLGDYDNEKPA
jgi:site-specific DNA-adenine methylase